MDYVDIVDLIFSTWLAQRRATLGPHPATIDGSQRTTPVTTGPSSAQLTDQMGQASQVASTNRRSLTREGSQFRTARWHSWGHAAQATTQKQRALPATTNGRS
jgi:hypothetical protein